jgi:hypothetical protein
MATVIERPGERAVEDRTYYTGDNSAAGWAVALVILAVLALIALFAWPGLARRANVPASTGAIQVNVPQSSGAGSVVPSTPVNNTTPTTNTTDTGPTGANAQ